MTTYGLIPSPKVSEDLFIYSANNGQGYIKNKELHIIGDTYHFVYKMDGWYLRNTITYIDHYLGDGACPTINLDGANIINQEYWNAITFTLDI